MPKISAVLIVQNEEALLGRCLESLKGIDEIIVCDQGSTDKTMEVAAKYTDKIFTDHKWNDNFAESRNAAKMHATGDWILSIDADEVLYDLPSVKEAVALGEQHKAMAVDTLQIAEDGDPPQEFYFPRLFKNVPQVFWESPIHNTLSVTGEKLGNVRIKVGYSPAHKNDPDRSFRILKRDVDSRFHPRSMYYLGREYWYRKDFENTVVMMGKYVQVSNFLGEKADAFLIMSRAYWEMKDANSARDACVQALIINANFKEAIEFMAIIAGDGSGNERWQANADQWKKMAETADNRDVLFIRT